jgi:hypothetical protein
LPTTRQEWASIGVVLVGLVEGWATLLPIQFAQTFHIDDISLLEFQIGFGVTFVLFIIFAVWVLSRPEKPSQVGPSVEPTSPPPLPPVDDSPFSEEQPIYTVHGRTNGASGIFTLTDDFAVVPFTEFPFPFDMDLKVWPMLRGGPELTVHFQCAHDGKTFEPRGSEDLTNAKAALPIENRTPHEFIKMTRNDEVRVAYSGADATKPSFVDFAYQLTQSD